MKMKKTLALNQAGIASIIVTLLLMLIVSLIVLGFATVSRREQRQSLDRQLNSQAYYAAETGINDVQKYIKDQLLLSPIFTTGFNQCTGPGSFEATYSAYTGIANSNVIGGGGTTSYSCVLVDPTPPELVYQDVEQSGSIVVPINNTSASPIQTITLSWQATDNSIDFGACPAATTFPAGNAWPCGTGGLRVELAQFDAPRTRDDLINAQKVAVFMPVSGVPSIWTPGASPGDIVGVGCSSATVPRYCSVTINALNITTTAYLRIRTLYRPASLQISASDGSSTVRLSGAQAVVDVTGKANDILKRVQARIPISPTSANFNTTFGFAIESVDSICKKYILVPPATVTDNSGTADPSCVAP